LKKLEWNENEFFSPQRVRHFSKELNTNISLPEFDRPKMDTCKRNEWRIKIRGIKKKSVLMKKCNFSFYKDSSPHIIHPNNAHSTINCCQIQINWTKMNDIWKWVCGNKNLKFQLSTFATWKFSSPQRTCQEFHWKSQRQTNCFRGIQMVKAASSKKKFRELFTCVSLNKMMYRN